MMVMMDYNRSGSSRRNTDCNDIIRSGSSTRMMIMMMMI